MDGARDELFACARLAAHEDVDTARRGETHEPPHFTHGLGRADDGVQRLA